MASEYLKRKYKDVKPDEKVELTAQEKRKNWWYYNKWYVVAAAVLVLIAVDLVWNWMGRGEPSPDYQVAYVSSQPMPGDTAAAIEAGLAALGEDLNGDGQVLVQLRQYVSPITYEQLLDGLQPYVSVSGKDLARYEQLLEQLRQYASTAMNDPDGYEQLLDQLQEYLTVPEEEQDRYERLMVLLRQYAFGLGADPNELAATSVKLMTDVMYQESFLFLLEDPASFQMSYHALSRLDGTLPEEGDDSTEGSVLSWADCPALAGMDLGDYTYDVFGGEISGDSNQFVSQLFVARRGFWKEEKPEWQAGCEALWAKLLEGVEQ